jgi:hypothetical protein
MGSGLRDANDFTGMNTRTASFQSSPILREQLTLNLARIDWSRSASGDPLDAAQLKLLTRRVLFDQIVPEGAAKM